MAAKAVGAKKTGMNGAGSSDLMSREALGGTALAKAVLRFLFNCSMVSARVFESR